MALAVGAVLAAIDKISPSEESSRPPAFRRR